MKTKKEAIKEIEKIKKEEKERYHWQQTIKIKKITAIIKGRILEIEPITRETERTIKETKTIGYQIKEE